MAEPRVLDLHTTVPEPPDDLLSMPALRRRVSVRRESRRAAAVLATMAVIAGIVVVAAHVGGSTPAPVSNPSTIDGLLVFARHSVGPDPYMPNSALYVSTSSGRDVRRITPIGGLINEVEPSSDGSKVAYSAETYEYGAHRHVTGDYIHVMNADGTHNRTVYRCPNSTCESLEWSPSGDDLLINGNVVLGSDGHVTQICAACDGGHPIEGATWSPDGSRLAFQDAVVLHRQQGTSTISAIGVANADGTNVRLLTNLRCSLASQSHCTYDTSPTWSPTGDDIAFLRLKPNFLRLDQSLGLNPSGPTSVETIRSDGSVVAETQACPESCQIRSLLWDQEGGRVAFVTSENSYRNETTTSTIHVADVVHDTAGSLRIRTHTSQPNDHWLTPVVSWAPSGTALTMVAHQTGRPTGVYVIQVHGTAMSAPVLAHRDAYPPVAWLPDAS